MNHTTAKSQGLNIGFDRTYERDYIHGQHVVDRQIIITGKPGDIDSIVWNVNTNINPTLDLRDGEEPIAYQISIEGPLDSITVEAGLEIRLYDLQVIGKQNGVQHRREEFEEDVWKVVREVYVQAKELGVIVLADPNLITKCLTNGGSGSVNGGPGGPSGGNPDEDDFWNHWSYRPVTDGSFGIHLEEENGVRSVTANGEGVDIIVFDTVDPTLAVDGRKSDLLDEKGYPIGLTLKSEKNGKILLRYAYQAHRHAGVNCCVKYNYGAQHPKEVLAHGGFVSGLIQRVAPEADIHLLDVLDEHGRGDLFTLLKRLHQLIEQASQEQADKVLLNKLVINFSFGVAVSETAMIEEKVRNAIWDLFTETQENGNSNEQMGTLLEGMAKKFYYVPSLRLLIQKLTDQGTVFVAAAGNDSGARYGRVPMQIPARYPEVIGVVASGKDGQIACFSNDDIRSEKKVKAPGGDADETFCRITDLDEKWEKSTKHENEKDFSDFALISVVSQATKPKGFAYWRGTSFSTAMVSGLAALVIQKMGLTSPSDQARQVKELIRDGLGERGVINVKKTLEGIKA